MTSRASLVLALLPALVPGCDRDEPASTGEPVVIGYSALRISLPVFVAAQEGLFERHGLDVTLKRYETAQPLVEELLDGRVPAAGYAALPIVYTAASRDGSEARLIGAMLEDEAHPVSYLLRPAGEGAPRTVEDLRGRRVGILPTVAYRRWLDLVLRSRGVDPDEVTITPIAPPQQVAALGGGGIDALFTNDPMATAAIERGVAEPLVVAPVPRALGQPLLFGSFLVHPRFAREHPGVVRRIAAALDDAIRIVHDNPVRAKRAMLPFVRSAERPYVTRYPDARYLASHELDGATLERDLALQLRHGVLDAPLDLTGWTFVPVQAP